MEYHLLSSRKVDIKHNCPYYPTAPGSSLYSFYKAVEYADVGK